MTLTAAQQEELLKALLKAFPRAVNLEALAQRVFQAPLDQVAMGDDLGEVAQRFLRKAQAKSKIELLVESALELQPSSEELKKFSEFHLANVFSAQAQQGLVEAARSGHFKDEVLLTCFRKSWPARSPSSMPGADGGDLLIQLVSDLGDALPQADGSIPLLRFAALLHLQAQQGTEAAPKLKQWLVDAARKRGVDAQALLLQVTQELAQEREGLYLLLRLEMASEGRCTVQAWLSQGENGIMRSILADDTPRELDGMGKLLSQLLEQLSSELEDANNQLLIEVLLPQELLCHAVERWELDRGRLKVLCGCKHPVVVRSWERVYEQRLSRQLRPDWARKWKDLQEQPPVSRPEAVVWEPDPEDKGKLIERLSDNGVVCLALMKPQEGGSAATSEELYACIVSGAPVGLWGRKWPEGARQELQQLLTDLRRLPEKVHALRVKARKAGEGHVGHSLVLFWDNPNRVPPDALPDSRFTMRTT